MNTVVSFKTPDGEDMIVLGKSDYEALLECSEFTKDVAAVDAYRRKLAAGEQEAIPETLAHRLIDGANPIRVYREWRGLSAKERAERTGISAAFLSESENGKKEGGVSTLKRIALELNVSLDDLVTGEQESDMAIPVTIDLLDGRFERVKAAAAQLGQSPLDFIREAIQERIDDVEDVRSAEAALKKIPTGEMKTYPLEDVIRKLGLEN